MTTVTITRKIEIYPTGEAKKESWDKIKEYSRLTFKAANIATSHNFFQLAIGDFFYLTDSAKVLFADIAKADTEKDNGAERVLNTSKQNTTYQVLSSHFKGLLPSDVYSNLNAQLVGVFSKESSDYLLGNKSLRSYRYGMPIPFSSKCMTGIALAENQRDYDFTLFGMTFRTKFGRDASGNRDIFDRGISGEYKFCNSSIKCDMEKNKLFLLAVFQFESDHQHSIDPFQRLELTLGADTPIIAKYMNNEFKIGAKGEFLHRLNQIRKSKWESKIDMRYNTGGKGRTKKMKAANRYRDCEARYTMSKAHQYTSKVVQYAISEGFGSIDLVFEEKKNLIPISTVAPLLEYKCKMAGIVFIDRVKEQKKKEAAEKKKKNKKDALAA